MSQNKIAIKHCYVDELCI